MLTNTNWIAAGKSFPPKAEQERLQQYKNNEKLFLGQHTEVFRGEFQKIESYLKKRHMDVGTVFNYPQLLTKKTADFVCGEPVQIGAGKKTDKLRGVLDELQFDSLLYEAVMDVSRFGDAPIKMMGDRVSSIAPDCWFPIVDPTDVKRITQHVVAFPTQMDENGDFTRLYVEIHDIGSVEVRSYDVSYSTDGRSIEFGELVKREVIKTNLDDFAIVVLKNVSHSKNVFGMDDYTAISSLVSKIIWRLHCVDMVLDKHSEPSLSGPASALSYDERTGLRYLDLGNYFKVNDSSDARVEYLTWDGNLESSFKEIELLINQLYIISEMGAAFMDGSGTGQVQSGTALKLRMTSPVIKAQRIAGINSGTVKKLIRLIAKIKGIALETKDIALTWNDGLPNDPGEELELLMAANGGLPVESQLSTVCKWNRVGEDEAKKMLEQADVEKKAAGDEKEGNAESQADSAEHSTGRGRTM